MQCAPASSVRSTPVALRRMAGLWKLESSERWLKKKCKDSPRLEIQRVEAYWPIL